MLIINNRFLSVYDYNFLLFYEKIFSVKQPKDQRYITFFTALSLLIINLLFILCVTSKQRECWKLRDSRLNSEFDSRVHGQPSISFSESILSTFNQESESRLMEYILCFNLYFIQSRSLCSKNLGYESKQLSRRIFPQLIFDLSGDMKRDSCAWRLLLCAYFLFSFLKTRFFSLFLSVIFLLSSPEIAYEKSFERRNGFSSSGKVFSKFRK